MAIPIRGEREVYTQKMMREYLRAANLLDDALQHFNQVAEQHLDAVRDGADIEVGTHRAWIETRQEGGKFIEELKVR